MSESKEKAPVDRKAELLARRTEREKAQTKQLEALELQALELEDQLANEGGIRGQTFDILDLSDLGEPPVAFKVNVPGIQAMWKAFVAGKKEDSDIDAFIAPCVASPDISGVRQIASRRPEIPAAIANSIARLMGVGREASSKK